MKIIANNISKKYNDFWIFRNFSQEFITGKTYAILGSNGSGKSTIIKCLIGLENPTKGEISFYNDAQTAIDKTKIYQDISFCAPAQEIIEEFTIKEFLDFHFTFKQMEYAHSKNDIIDILELRQFIEVPIRDYSSGMKQRVKLAQAFFSKTAIMCLDEPTTNLDENWIGFYVDFIKKTSHNRLVLIASNQEIEYSTSDEEIIVENYKS